MRRRALVAARVGLPLAVLAVLLARLGPEAFRPALAVLSPWPLLAALVLGGAAVAAQAARWRAVAAGAGLRLGVAESVAEVYRAGALNAALPGGVAGDVARAWRQRAPGPGGWRVGAGTVVAERALGTAVLAAAAAAVLAPVAPPAALGAAAASVAAVAVAVPALRRLPLRARLAGLGWSVVALGALLGLVVVAAGSVGAPHPRGVVLALGVALLAGMSVPVNLGGWGPREGAAALAAVALGLPAAEGVAVAAGYGLLAAASVLPGVLVLAGLEPPRAAARSSSTQVSSPSRNRRDGARTASASRSAP